jgi:hypothetical protein
MDFLMAEESTSRWLMNRRRFNFEKLPTFTFEMRPFAVKARLCGEIKAFVIREEG